MSVAQSPQSVPPEPGGRSPVGHRHPAANRNASGRGRAGGDQASRLIDERIEEACRALWWAELVRGGLTLLLVTMTALLAWVAFDHWIHAGGFLVRGIALAGLIAGAGWFFVRRIVPLFRSQIRPEYAARSLEHDVPEMRHALTSYVTLRGDGGPVSGLRNVVVRSIGTQAAGHLTSYDRLPREATGTFPLWIASAVALAALVGYALLAPKDSFSSAGRLLAPLASIEPPRRVSIRDVFPGDADVTAGRPIEVSATVEGLSGDEGVWCRWKIGGGERAVRLEPGERPGEFLGVAEVDPMASGEIPYRIEAGDAVAGPYLWNVEDVPVVALRSIGYEPPAYTGKPARVSTSGSITAVDGTAVTVRVAINRPVRRATLELNPRAIGDSARATGGTVEMKLGEDRQSAEVTFPLRSSRRRSATVEPDSYQIRVVDDAGRENSDPVVYSIRVIEDLSPEIAIVVPQKTPKNVPIDAQQVIEVHALDADFGLKEIGLRVNRGIRQVDASTLWTDANGKRGNQVAEYRFRPRRMGLRVGDVVQIVATRRRQPLDPGRPVGRTERDRILSDRTEDRRRPAR